MTKVDCEGFLEKRKKYKKTWRYYWFVLEGDQLLYYKDPQRESPRGLIDLRQTIESFVLNKEFRKRPFRIILTTQSRSHILSADQEEIRDCWYIKIFKAMRANLRRTFSIDRSPSCNTLSDQEGSNDVDDINTNHLFNSIIDKKDPVENVGKKQFHSSEAPSQNSSDSEENSKIDCADRPDSIEHIFNRSSNNISFKSKNNQSNESSISNDDSIEYILSSSSSSILSSSGSHADYLLDDSLLSALNSDLDNLSFENNCLSDILAQNDTVFPPIPPLPHPRLELLCRSRFDDVRLFIAKHRGPDEIFDTITNSMENGASHIDKLKSFLNCNENDNFIHS